MEGIQQYGSQNNPQDQQDTDEATQNMERLGLQSPPPYKKSEYAKILSNLTTFKESDQADVVDWVNTTIRVGRNSGVPDAELGEILLLKLDCSLRKRVLPFLDLSPQDEDWPRENIVLSAVKEAIILVAKGSLNDNDKMAAIQKMKVDPTSGGHLKLLQEAESSWTSVVDKASWTWKAFVFLLCMRLHPDFKLLTQYNHGKDWEEKKKNGPVQGSLLIQAINRHTSCWRATTPSPPPCHAPSCRPTGRPPQSSRETGEPREFPSPYIPLGLQLGLESSTWVFPGGTGQYFCQTSTL